MLARTQSPWLFGSGPDLLLGSGALYLLILAGLIGAGSGLSETFPSGSFAYFVLIISGSHYGATLLRVYEHEAERRVYRTYAVYGTIVIFAALLGALHAPLFGSALITLYLTWSPWHYTGQNYGISMMFLRRRGVEVPPVAQRLLRASFVLSFASVVLNFHFQGGVSQGDPLGYTSLAGGGFRFLSLGLPAEIRTVLMPIIVFAYVAATAAALAILWQRSSARAVAPTAILVFTQAAWFSIPHMGFYFDLGAIIPAFDARSGESFRFYFFWTAIGHALQYLWITTYYARSDRRWRGYGNYLSKAFVCGNAIWAAPVVVFGPGLTGSPDYESGLAMCVAAAVNLHHFVLDGAIWKLRNPKIAAILLRSSDRESNDDRRAAASGWPARVAWSAAIVFCLAKIIPYVEVDRRLPAALRESDLATSAAILDRAAFYGRDSANARAVLANRLVEAREPDLAVRHYRRSLELRADAFGFAELGRLVGKLEGAEAAIETWRSGLDLFPNDPALNRLAGLALVRAERSAEALPYLERAATLDPTDLRVRDALRVARQRSRG